MIRALTYDVSGFWLMTKRLSKGTFSGWPTKGAINTLAAIELRALLSDKSYTHSKNLAGL
jgi:hypothetical protein